MLWLNTSREFFFPEAERLILSKCIWIYVSKTYFATSKKTTQKPCPGNKVSPKEENKANAYERGEYGLV